MQQKLMIGEDENLTEKAICPTMLGHKNWMFIGGEHTGRRSAVIHTVLEARTTLCFDVMDTSLPG